LNGGFLEVFEQISKVDVNVKWSGTSLLNLVNKARKNPVEKAAIPYQHH
jgi:hypothetical protein